MLVTYEYFDLVSLMGLDLIGLDLKLIIILRGEVVEPFSRDRG